MVGPTTPSTGDIWHLSIDDLLAPLPEKTCLGGPGPFVINLSASTAPIEVPKNLDGCGTAHLYRLQRMEDRRPRYRLRVGLFARENEADAVLQKVRDVYPGALTATADADDLRAIAQLQAKAAGPGAQAVAAHAAAVQPAAAKPLTPARPSAIAPATVPAAQSVLPAPVSPPVLTSALKMPARAPAATPRVAPPAEAARIGDGVPIPILETTQTVRALTAADLKGDSSWFVIQLSLAEQAFDPETVPNLDIFSLYRLYCVAGVDKERTYHALRLGFFSEEVAARAVASYLAAFYERPTIQRISAAERQRFGAQALEPRKDVGATGKQAVIEITNERYIRERRGHAAGK